MENLELKNIEYQNLKLIHTIADGNCFFHAIVNAIDSDYCKIDNNKKIKTVIEKRKYLSEMLEKKDKNNKIIYDNLSRGNLKQMSKFVDEYKLENMKKTLNSNSYVSNLYNEFISNILNIDIYILDKKTEDVYITGDDMNLLYKNRPSIVLLYDINHYSLVGVVETDTVLDFFQYDHPFIKCIKNRMIFLLKIRIKKDIKNNK